MTLRIPVSGMRSNSGMPGRSAAAAFASAGAAAAAGLSAGRRAAASMSAFTIRPFGPLPFRVARSIPACSAIRRARGDTKMRPARLTDAPCSLPAPPTAASTSSLVIRPPGPLPVRVERSIPAAFAILAASGEASTAPVPGEPVGAGRLDSASSTASSSTASSSGDSSF